jgi:hypothetical protein
VRTRTEEGFSSFSTFSLITILSDAAVKAGRTAPVDSRLIILLCS